MNIILVLLTALLSEHPSPSVSMKKLCLLGATGSIGKSCVDIVNRFPEKFSIRYVSAHRNIEDLFALAQQFRPEIAVLSGTTVEAAWQTKFKRIGVKIESGVEALAELAGQSDYDLLVNAVVGAAGLQPTLSAIGQNKNVAIGNAAGEGDRLTGGRSAIAIQLQSIKASVQVDS